MSTKDANKTKISHSHVKCNRNDDILVYISIAYFLNLALITCKDTFRFASHYADHMVLQRTPYAAVLWGVGEENALVNVSLAGKLYPTIVQKGKQFVKACYKIIVALYSLDG